MTITSEIVAERTHEPPLVEQPPRRLLARIFRRSGTGGIGKSLAVWLSAAWMVLIIGAAVLAPILPLRDYADTNSERLLPMFSGADFLGTDMIGRSVLSRIIYGAQVSLTVAFCATGIGLVLGFIFGLLAGYLRGWTERIVDVIANTVLAFPGLILLLALVSVLSPSTQSLTLALGISVAPSFIRVVKANALSQINREYVMAARAIGAKTPRILIRELLPNTVVPVTSMVAAILAICIIAEGSLSFLGFGIAPPQPSWGGMIADGRDQLAMNATVVLIPCIVMFLTVFAFNTLGDRLRSLFDIREAKL